MNITQLPEGLIIPEGWKAKILKQIAGKKTSKIYLELKKKKPHYPKTWEDLKFSNINYPHSGSDEMIALSKLLAFRNEYRRIANGGKDWSPEWKNDDQLKFAITMHHNGWVIYDGYWPKIFSFPTEESCRLFLKNFQDNLLEEVKPLFTS